MAKYQSFDKMGEISLQPIQRTRRISRFIFRFLAIASIFIIAIEFVQNEHHPGVDDGEENRTEVLQILQTTPNLWRYRGRQDPNVIRNETVASRIAAQQEWTTQLASTNFIKNVKRDEYGFTENRLQCPYAPSFEDKCELVLETKSVSDLLQNHPSESYYRDLQVDAVIGIRNGYWGDDKYPEPTLPPGIQQIYYVTEFPCHTGSARMGAKSYLASYSRGSDIPIPYFQYIRKNGSTSSQDNATNGAASNYATKDSRHLVAAMISNCVFVQNNRMGYIRALQNYIPVHVFGKCGEDHLYTCPESGDCLEHLGSRYKFYLSFENCNCEDYITEKFFQNALQHNMVPVVMGGRRENYESAAPPNSFIHVDDFPSPEELAKYLQILDSDDKLYKKYTSWQRPGMGEEIELSSTAWTDFFCRACGLLYYADFLPAAPYRKNVTRWKELNECLPKNEWNWPS